MENDGNENLNQEIEGDQLLDDDYIPADAKPLCPSCLQPCEKSDYYCRHCGSHQAINPLTAYMPFQNIRYNYGGFGVMWRRLWDLKQTPFWQWLIYLFVFTLFAPFLLIILCLSALIFDRKKTYNPDSVKK